MSLFSASDIIHAVNFAWQVYNLGWSEELNVSKQYQDFWNDVKGLAENLSNISRIVENARAAWTRHSLPLVRSQGLPSQKDWDLTSLREIIGDYHKTLTDCRELLEENPEFRKDRNFAYNIEWNKVIQPKVELLRKRLEFHNTKILVLLRPLELNLLSEIHRDLAGRIDAVHHAVRQLHGLLIPDVAQAMEEQASAAVVDVKIPADLENRFRAAAERSFPEIRTAGNFPLQAGADSFIEYFEESTKSFTARGSFLDERTPLPQQYLALLKCVWIMRCLSGCEALRSAPADSQWHGYVQQLREDLSIECQRFLAPTPLAQRLIVPDLSGLSNDDACDIWLTEDIAGYMSRHTEEQALEEVLRFPMPSQSESLRRDLKILRLGSTRYRFVESVEDRNAASTRHQEQKMEIDLKTVNFMPLYAIPSSRSKALEVVVASPTADLTPTFLEPKHIFSLQHLLTGYKVYGRYDQGMVTVSFTIPGQSKPLEEHGRLQLWLPRPFSSASTPSSAASSIAPSQYGNSRTSLITGIETMSLANSRSDRAPSGIASPTSPSTPFSPISSNMSRNSSTASSFRENAIPGRMAGLSSLSFPDSISRSRTLISMGDTRESMSPSRQSSQSTTNKLTKARRPPSITPSTRTTSSVSSRTSVSSVTTVSTGTGRAQIHSKPAKPLLVIFLKSKEVSGKLAIVAIQIDEKTRVERERCGCRSSNSRCEASCIERAGGDLLAQRWDADRLGNWNLAKLSVEQRKELPEDAWNDLKRVKLKFDSLEDRLKFSGKPCSCKPLMQHDLSKCVLEGHHGVFGIVKQIGSQSLRNYHRACEEAAGRTPGGLSDGAFRDEHRSDQDHQLRAIKEYKAIFQTTVTSTQEVGSEEAEKWLITIFLQKTFRKLSSILGGRGKPNLSVGELSHLFEDFFVRLECETKPGHLKSSFDNLRQQKLYIVFLFQEFLTRDFLNRGDDEEGEADQDQVDSEVESAKTNLLKEVGVWTGLRQNIDPHKTFHIADLTAALEDDGSATGGFPEAWEFLAESHAYIWLTGKIMAAVVLTETQGSRMEHIGAVVMTGLKAVAQGYGYDNGVWTGSFDIVAWDLPGFIHQEYPQEQELKLGLVITITGSGIDAQALTCAEYMRQVWPATGYDTLKALEEAIDKGIGYTHKCITIDSTQLTIEVYGPSINVMVKGTKPAVIEISQQLAWLGAALRSSLSPNKICLSEPDISIIETNSFLLTFKVMEIELQLDKEQSLASGTCWQPLFRNPVIVQGYPILARSHEERGLEIPLNMMAGLGEASRVTNFDDGLLIKGFSTLFYPTWRVDNSIQWHYLFNKDGSRISYLAAEDKDYLRLRSTTLDTTSLMRCRNFLGWASVAEINAGKFRSPLNYIPANASIGAKVADYNNIEWPSSSFASPGVAFEKASVVAGSYLSGGASFTRGIKDTPLYLHRGGPYEQEIHSAYNMKVILYDTNDRRAWLLNGASALLHITRTQLSSSPYSDSTLFSIDQFQHANPEEGQLGAKKALLNFGNRRLVIFEDVETATESKGVMGEDAKEEIKTRTTRWTYQDLVRQTYHILEQLHDYETKILSSPAIGLRFTDREKLTGFAFMDIVGGQNDLRPRVVTLRSSGKGWVDFTRSIRAFTLLGKGFGEIIKPSAGANQLCKNWKAVPTGKDYLVACTSTLKEICKRYGHHDAKRVELAKGIYWHKPDRLFEACDCRSRSCDRVQVLLPASLGSKRNPQLFDYDKGAVIFGRSKRFPWTWPSKGDPVEGGSSDGENEDASDFHDSALGSQSPGSLDNFGSMSLTSSSSNATDVSAGERANMEYVIGGQTDVEQSIPLSKKSSGEAEAAEEGNLEAARAGSC